MKINPIGNLVKTKPIQSQYKPNSRNVQIDVNLVKTRNFNNEQRTMNYELLCKLVRHSLGEGGTNPTCRGVVSGEAGSNPTCSELVEPISNPTTDSTVLIKLWYWIMNNKLNVLKELKQLQLQIAELENIK